MNVYSLNPNLEQELNELMERIPPGDCKNTAMRILRHYRAAKADATPLLTKVEKRLAELDARITDVQSKRVVTFTLDDPAGARVQVHGTLDAVLDYASMLADALGNHDAANLAFEMSKESTEAA